MDIVHMPTDPPFSSWPHSELQPSEHLKVESSIWLPLNVVSNGNSSSSSQAVGVTKIAKSVIAPLAQQHVSVFMLSTYQTDFILVSPVYLSLFTFFLFHSSLNGTHKYLFKIKEAQWAVHCCII